MGKEGKGMTEGSLLCLRIRLSQEQENNAKCAVGDTRLARMAILGLIGSHGTQD